MELFDAMAVKEVKVEQNLVLTTKNFINDFVKVIDEVKAAADIVRIWHVDFDLSSKLFSTLTDVLYGDALSDTEASSSDESEDVEDDEDVLDDDSDSSNDEIDRLSLLDIFDDN